MTTLTDLLKQTRALRAKAMVGEWQDRSGYTVPKIFTKDGRYVAEFLRGEFGKEQGDKDKDFVIHAANQIDKICRAAELMYGILEYYKIRGHVGSHTSGHGESSDHISFYDGLKITPEDALAKADAIAAGKE